MLFSLMFCFFASFATVVLPYYWIVAATTPIQLPFERLAPLRHGAVRDGRAAQFDAKRISLVVEKSRKAAKLKNRKKEERPSSSSAASVKKLGAKEGGPSAVGQVQEDDGDVVWIGQITIGSPQQSFNVQMDTGSSMLWIPDSSICPTDTSFCNNPHNYFNNSLSTTYISTNAEPFEISYGIGYASGFFGNDVVRIGAMGTAQLSIKGTTFGQATNISSDTDASPTDGVFGLAYQPIDPDNSTVPMLMALEQGLLAQPLFTVWLGTVGGQVFNQKGGGLITFGGYDFANCAPVIVWVPLLPDFLYAFTVNSVQVIGAGKHASFTYSTASTAIADTGTSLIYVPSRVMRGIARVVGASYNSTYGSYLVACRANYPPVVFSIAGHLYPLTHAVLTIDAGIGGGLCQFAVMDLSLPASGNSDIGGEEEVWILGDPFIRQYCVVFNMGNATLGFASTITAAGSNHHQQQQQQHNSNLNANPRPSSAVPSSSSLSSFLKDHYSSFPAWALHCPKGTPACVCSASTCYQLVSGATPAAAATGVYYLLAPLSCSPSSSFTGVVESCGVYAVLECSGLDALEPQHEKLQASISSTSQNQLPHHNYACYYQSGVLSLNSPRMPSLDLLDQYAHHTISYVQCGQCSVKMR